MEIKKATRQGFQIGNKLGLKHGLSKTTTYRKWVCMKWRCKHDPHYIANGIQFAQEWESFDQFLKDMGECPPGHELDREKNDGHYTPENCRWVTRPVQQRNKSNSRHVTYNGKTQCARDWATELGIHYATLIYRLRHGWTTEEAFTTPGRTNEL